MVTCPAVHYFAYGANMARRVLARRNIRPSAWCRGILHDYRLAFELPGLPLFDPVFSTVVPAPGERTHGVVFTITEKEFERLAAFEFTYRPDVVNVETEAGVVSAQTFVAKRRIQGKKPSPRYVRLLCEGAREAELPAAWIHRLESQPTCSDVPLASWMVHVVERVMGKNRRGT